ncbi:MAG: hypothetical protein U5K79_21200 [Cyclobacteriaceae bacterium]|nr:hypothetical protein [Cyclobacteriaceae bacterium]
MNQKQKELGTYSSVVANSNGMIEQDQRKDEELFVQNSLPKGAMGIWKREVRQH